MMQRRRFMKFGGAAMTLLVSRVGFAAETSILAVRVWPSQDYTRVTLEGRDTLKYSHQIVKNPERLVIDLEGAEFNSVIQSLPGKITDSDPYIKLIRAGRNRPGVVRLVIELKAEVKPQVFTLEPVGQYGHRLVLDLYPAEPIDPLLALIEKPDPIVAASGEAASPTRPTAQPGGDAGKLPSPPLNRRPPHRFRPLNQSSRLSKTTRRRSALPTASTAAARDRSPAWPRSRSIRATAAKTRVQSARRVRLKRTSRWQSGAA
ncbi:AMIN domain-containing protein [Niveibacterium microcysteis]|uniref:AMIN domain-containing protein n=1 Tax=Niveibacterium microcysteis TaxID=2811415 RepID=A0ABX7MBR9_9RHOO|nr:AMIN domain-containing protein [Niveibacterium microcysteis]QSI79151.1 AMIN domain-containing protein [Niveibacterium microcysteis]